MFQSAIWAEQPSPRATAATVGPDGDVQPGLAYAPMYWIAIAAAAQDQLPEIEGMHWFGDQTESVYAHYNHEIRKNKEAGTLLAERDTQLAALRSTATARPWWQRWFGKKGTQ